MTNTTKTTLYAILGILIALAAFYGVSEYQKRHASERLTLREITQLKEEERIKALEDRTRELADQVKNFAVNSTSSAKYQVYIQLAEAQLELNKPGDALNTLNSIPEDQKNNSRVAAAYVRAYNGAGDKAKAKEMSAVNIVQYSEEPSVWLAHFEANSDLPNDQLNALYRQAIPATKSHVDIMVSYAKFSEKIGDKATAIAAWETARNVDPDRADMYNAEIQRLQQ